MTFRCISSAVVASSVLVALVAPSVASAAPSSPIAVRVAAPGRDSAAVVVVRAMSTFDHQAIWNAAVSCRALSSGWLCGFRNANETGSALVRFSRVGAGWQGELEVRRLRCLPSTVDPSVLARPSCVPVG